MIVLPLAERREAIRILAATRNREGLCSVQLPIDDTLVQSMKYMVALLLQHQAHPDTKDLHGNTPLAQALLAPSNPTIIQLFLQAGARTDLLDEHRGGMDALIWADRKSVV